MSGETEAERALGGDTGAAAGERAEPSSAAGEGQDRASEEAAASTRSQKRKAKRGEPGPNSAVERPEVQAGAYHVTLPSFAGPLDLLLHLIQQHELDIKDIPIAFISEKYLEYIMLMQDLNIDLASEYLVMAATLAHIKSKMLLPKPPADQDDDSTEEMDPRGELVRRLLEYQKYKQAAEALGESPVLGRDVFLRGAPAPSIDGPAPLAQVSVFKLFDAFQRLLSRAKQTAEHLIDVDRISISERIIELTDMLRSKGRTRFEDLFHEESTRSDLIVTFLALLEMTRLRMMVVAQEAPLSPIFVELTLGEEHEEILHRDPSAGDPLAALARGDVENRAPSLQDSDPAENPGPSEVLGESVGPTDSSRGAERDPSHQEAPSLGEGTENGEQEVDDQLDTAHLLSDLENGEKAEE